jgi:tripartite-type tricarboxylate transporter receptor subunit TctC
MAPAYAAAFPERPLRLVITYPPGGSTDIVGRLVGAKLSEFLGQPVTVENKPGAAGMIGAADVARSSADGYTLLIHIVTTAVISPMLQKVQFDPRNDFQPVGMIAKLPNVMIINKDIPASNLREFIDWAKANPGKVNYGTGGTGSVQHLSGELLNQAAGLRMVHVPYKGAPPAIQDLIGGNLAAVFDNVTGTIGPIRSGLVRAIGVTSGQRIESLPDVPTLSEAGLPEFKNSSWISVFTRAGVPKDVLTTLESATLKAANDPALKGRLEELGAVPEPMGSGELDRFWKSEFDYWRQAINAANLKIE